METDPRDFFADLTCAATGLSRAQLELLCTSVDEGRFATNAAYRVAVHADARTLIEEATGQPATFLAVRTAADHVLSEYRTTSRTTPVGEPVDDFGVRWAANGEGRQWTYMWGADSVEEAEAWMLGEHLSREKDLEVVRRLVTGAVPAGAPLVDLRAGLLMLRHAVATEGTAASWAPERFIVRLDHLLGGPPAPCRT